jgi:hypothetical protein
MPGGAEGVGVSVGGTKVGLAVGAAVGGGVVGRAIGAGDGPQAANNETATSIANATKYLRSTLYSPSQM